MAVSLLLEKAKQALAKGSVGRRNELLQHVTDLFILGAPQFEDKEIAQFDEIIMQLAVDIELSARALLSIRLGPIAKAPPRTIYSLAFDDAIDVAGPVLIQSEQLTDSILVENAKQKSQEHLLAISQRRSLNEMVTDILVERGDRQVVFSTVGNRGAKFSVAGFEKLIERSAGDDALSERVGSRPEIPPQLFAKLLAVASEAVRAKLEALHPEHKGEVRRAVAEVTERIRSGKPTPSSAQDLVEQLHQSGELDDKRLGEFAKAGDYPATTAALALMCDLPVKFIESAMKQKHAEALLVIAKVIGLSWPTIKAILLLRSGKRGMSADELSQCLAQFERLKSATANEIVRFYRLREGGTGSKPS